MSIAPGNDAITWRDIADQLTAEQIQKLVDDEGKYQDPERVLLWDARNYARAKLFDTLIGPVEVPLGAAVVDVWRGNGGEMPHRFIQGEPRPVTDKFAVFSSVCQLADGSIDDGNDVEAPGVFIDGGEPLPLDRLRALVAALQECLEEIDGWTAR